MQVNNTFDCYKPRRISTFKGENPESSGRKVRYKHFEQMDEDTLSLHSVVKAHKDVEKSAKMRLFKAMPHITTAALGITIGITQPGKLAAKAGAGLGFLALSQAVSFGEKIIRDIKVKDRNEDTKKSTLPRSLSAAKNVALAVGAVGVGVALAKSKSLNKIKKFAACELKQVSNEINNSALGKKVNKFIEEKMQKHSDKLSVFGVVAPIATIVGASALELNLADSLSNDIKEKARANYLKGKMAQQQAREHFDSIDAKEI